MTPNKTKTDPDAPRLTPTAMDAADPFASTTQRAKSESLGTEPPAAPRLSPTLAESDPPTGLVRYNDYVDLPPGSVVGEIYEIDAKLGSGAMGEVYAARHMKLGKRVAIKVIGPRLSKDAAAIERFAQEARALAQIQHPAIVAVEHVGDLADGRAYFVMEYLHGESLFERLQRGRISLSKALRILDQMARGLEAAHAQGITHRDLKPENTYLVRLPGESSIVKLLDFGLAKLAVDVDQRAERTQSGVTVGTPMYMSPEQARGPDVDHRTDVYALGCVAYELLLGCPPFPHAKTAPELYAAHLYESPPLPRSIWPEIPPQLDLALFAMLAKDPAHRPTLGQVRSVIAAVRTATPSQRAATEFVAPRSSPKTRSFLIIACTLVSGILIGTILTTRPRGETARETPITAPAAPTTPVEHLATPTAAIDATPEAPAPHPRNTRGSGAPDAASKRLGDSRGGSGAPDATSKRLGDSRVSRPTPPPKVGNAASTEPAEPAVPAGAAGITTETFIVEDAGTAPIVTPAKTVPKPNKPIDRNQTVNPFPLKRDKVNP